MNGEMAIIWIDVLRDGNTHSSAWYFIWNLRTWKTNPPSLNVHIISISSTIQSLSQLWPILMLLAFADRQMVLTENFPSFRIRFGLKSRGKHCNRRYWIFSWPALALMRPEGRWDDLVLPLSLATRFFFLFLCFFFTSTFFFALNSFVASSFLRRTFGGIEVRWPEWGHMKNTRTVRSMHIMNDPGFGWLSYTPRDFASKGSKTRHETRTYSALFSGTIFGVLHCLPSVYLVATGVLARASMCACCVRDIDRDAARQRIIMGYIWLLFPLKSYLIWDVANA